MGAGKEGKEQHKGSAHQRPQVGIGQELLAEISRLVQQDTEEHADQAAEKGEKSCLCRRERGKCRKVQNFIGRCFQGKSEGDSPGDQRGDDAWQQGGVVHDSHADNFQGEHGCRDGGAKEGGKGRAHAAHDDDMPVF